MKWASAISREIDGMEAVRACIRSIQEGLGDIQPDILFAFISPHHREDYSSMVEALGRELSPAKLMGCSGGGVIGAGQEVEDMPGLSLMAAQLPGVELKLKHLTDKDLPSLDASPRAWEEALDVQASAEPHFLLLVNPFMSRAEDLLAGLDYAFPHAQKVGGMVSGLRSLQDRAMFTWDGAQGARFFNDGALVLALSGDLKLDTLVAQGCRGVGPVMTVTGCDRNLLTGLDGKPALKALTEVFEEAGPADRKLMNRALFVGLVTDPLMPWPPRHGDFLIRNVLGIDVGRRSLAVGAVLREGQALRFHVRDATAAAEDLRQVLERYAHESRGGPSPAGALLFSCLGRGESMYGVPDHDSRLFIRILGELPLGGFFCNGEIGPVGRGTFIHGFTSSFGIFRRK